jgi:hypothetical protein
MCDKCASIDETIARYSRFGDEIADWQLQQSAARIVGELEAKKAALHPK